MSHEATLRELERRIDADPKDSEALVARQIALSRRDGPDAFLEPLQDRQLWTKTHPAIQDLAIEEASRRLPENFTWKATRLYQCASQQHRIASYQHQSTGIILHLLPAGTVTIGSPAEDQDREPRDYSPTSCHIRQPFLMGRFPVTVQQWAKINGNPAQPDNQSDPVVKVSKLEVEQALDNFDGNFRLPSEAEWTYACRAGSDDRYFWGNHMDDSYCWYDKLCWYVDEQDLKKTRSVYEHWNKDKWNAFGLIDTLGNVWEFCQDSYSDTPPENEQAQRLPGHTIIARGGSWGDTPPNCRIADRYDVSTNSKDSFIGFRIAHSLETRAP